MDRWRQTWLTMSVVVALGAGGCAVRQDEPVRVAARSVAVLPPCDAAGRPLAGDTGDAQGLGELLRPPRRTPPWRATASPTWWTPALSRPL